MPSGSLAARQGHFFLAPLAKAGQRAEADALRLDHVFVIAGPSGSGKSTFMREFVEDRLPKDIADRIPLEAKTWKRSTGNEITRKGLSQVLRGPDSMRGLVLHYDIMRAHTRGFEYHANDPAMQAVTESGARLTILSILPTRELLFEQFLHRARTGEYEEWWDRREVKRRIKRKIRERIGRLLGRQPKFFKEGHLALLRIYSSDALFDLWIGRWENFLTQISQARDDVSLIYATPEPSDDGQTRFRLLRQA